MKPGRWALTGALVYLVAAASVPSGAQSSEPWTWYTGTFFSAQNTTSLVISGTNVGTGPATIRLDLLQVDGTAVPGCSGVAIRNPGVVFSAAAAQCSIPSSGGFYLARVRSDSPNIAPMFGSCTVTDSGRCGFEFVAANSWWLVNPDGTTVGMNAAAAAQSSAAAVADLAAARSEVSAARVEIAQLKTELAGVRKENVDLRNVLGDTRLLVEQANAKLDALPALVNSQRTTVCAEGSVRRDNQGVFQMYVTLVSETDQVVRVDYLTNRGVVGHDLALKGGVRTTEDANAFLTGAGAVFEGARDLDSAVKVSGTARVFVTCPVYFSRTIGLAGIVNGGTVQDGAHN